MSEADKARQGVVRTVPKWKTHTFLLKTFNVEIWAGRGEGPKLNICGLNPLSRHVTHGNVLIVGFYQNKETYNPCLSTFNYRSIDIKPIVMPI